MELQSPKVDKLHIGDIVIDLTTGEVKFPDTMTPTEAAKQFWTAVRDVYRSHDW